MNTILSSLQNIKYSDCLQSENIKKTQEEFIEKLAKQTIQKIRAHRYADIVHKYIAELDVETPIQSIEIFIRIFKKML